MAGRTRFGSARGRSWRRDAGPASGGASPDTAVEAPARLLGSVPWLFCLALAAVGVAGVTPLAWVGAALVAGLSLSGSI